MTHTVIVEDDPMVAQINRQYILQMENCCVDGIFSNGQDALDFFRTNTINLAILDIYMPGINGTSLLRKMRAEGIKCAVIIITAATEMTTVHDALRLGVIDYLIKPYTFARFKDAIQKYNIRMNIISSTKKADQSVVDQLLHNSLSDSTNDLIKGLNHKTLEFILTYLQNHAAEKHTCESLSNDSNLSKVTIRRYLNYLIENGQVISSIDYETGGRPRVLYHLV